MENDVINAEDCLSEFDMNIDGYDSDKDPGWSPKIIDKINVRSKIMFVWCLLYCNLILLLLLLLFVIFT